MEIRESQLSVKRYCLMLVLLLMLTAVALMNGRPAQATEWDPHDLIWNSDFYDEVTQQPSGQPWQADFDAGGSGVARVYAAGDPIPLGDGSTVMHGNAPDPDNGETYALCMSVNSPGNNRWSVQLRHRNMYLDKSHRYFITFDAWTSHPGVQLHPKIGHIEGPEYWNYNIHPAGHHIADTQNWWIGAYTDPGDATRSAEQVNPESNYDPSDAIYGFPHWWDPIHEMPQSWETYDKWWWENSVDQPQFISLEPSADVPTELHDTLTNGVGPQWDQAVNDFGADPQQQATVELAFHFGSQLGDQANEAGDFIRPHEQPENFVVCLDNIQLQDIGPVGHPAYPDGGSEADVEAWSAYDKEPTVTPDGIGPDPAAQAARAAAGEPVLAWSYRPIRVNQAGYFTNGSKLASVGLENPWSGEMDWNLYDGSGALVTSGTTQPMGDGMTLDPDSGQYIHYIDFSTVTQTGTGFYLELPQVNWATDDDPDRPYNTSQPFDIGDDIYEAFKYDAIKYFYINRSGGDDIDGSLLGGGVHSYPSDSPGTDSRAEGNSVSWDRQAGHISDAATAADDENKGDINVPCLGGIFTPDGLDPTDPVNQITIPDGAWAGSTGFNTPPCSYTKDVTGGWYDAGDHGKYVVNGGISVWTMMNQYERMIDANGSDIFGDFQIPESGDSIPDLLDEAAWQMEFILSMQALPGNTNGTLPAGYEGMVHHKIHDIVWTALARFPHEVALDRYLLAPTTAATLNLAASASQCARLFTGIDQDLADRCWAAAEIALTAAKANPDWYAPHRADFFSVINLGGGPYDDDYMPDDFYWAFTEAYITALELGDSDASSYQAEMMAYKAQVEAEFDNPSAGGPFEFCGGDSGTNPGGVGSSGGTTRSAAKAPAMIPHSGAIPHTVDCGVAGSFTWGTTSALGTLSLALSDAPEAADAAADVQSTADSHIAAMRTQGFLMPLTTDDQDEAGTAHGDYPWGSNSFVVNNLLILGLAHQTSNDDLYLDAMRVGIDFIFGRNAMNKCYVSDIDLEAYGEPGHAQGNYVCENYLQEPHHRTFSWIYDTSKFPVSPPGWMSGGANSVNSSWDPVQAIAAGLYCNDAPASCFQDKIDSWSTNEVTVNWNAPYAWVLAYLDETGDVMTAGFWDDAPPLAVSTSSTAADTTNATALTMVVVAAVAATSLAMVKLNRKES